MNTTDARRVLETALICAQQPMSVREMRTLFDDALSADSIRGLLHDLTQEWSQRGVELAQVASGWRFQSRPEMRPYLDRLHPEKPPRYTRATLETLAIVAYRQPVTRGDMEDIRGVTINSLILKQLEDRGWVEVIGHREAPGRPALYATTRQFLDDLGLESLNQLPLLSTPGEQASALEQLDLPAVADALPQDDEPVLAENPEASPSVPAELPAAPLETLNGEARADAPDTPASSDATVAAPDSPLPDAAVPGLIPSLSPESRNPPLDPTHGLHD